MLHFYKTKALLNTWNPWILGWPDPPACLGLGHQSYSWAFRRLLQPLLWGLGTRLQILTFLDIHC